MLRRNRNSQAVEDSVVGHSISLYIDHPHPSCKAKPCKSLWVSGISTSVSKEDLEEGDQICDDFLISHSRRHTHSSGGPKVDEEPSNVLWISCPFHIDEQMLHSAKILFGELRELKVFLQGTIHLLNLEVWKRHNMPKRGCRARFSMIPEYQLCSQAENWHPAKISLDFI